MRVHVEDQAGDGFALPPMVGGPVAASGGGCAYGGDYQPGSTPCAGPATSHVLCESAGWGLVTLPTCDTHLQVARAAGEWLAEHDYDQTTCGAPGAPVWLPVWNRCEPADDGPVSA